MGKKVTTKTLCECDWCGTKTEILFDGVPSGWTQDIHFIGPGNLFCDNDKCRADAKLFWDLAQEEGVRHSTSWYFKKQQEWRAGNSEVTGVDSLITEEVEQAQATRAN